jgi:hypothetical protein
MLLPQRRCIYFLKECKWQHFYFIFFGVKICSVAKFWKIYVTNFHDFIFFWKQWIFLENFQNSKLLEFGSKDTLYLRKKNNSKNFQEFIKQCKFCKNHCYVFNNIFLFPNCQSVLASYVQTHVGVWQVENYVRGKQMWLPFILVGLIVGP